MIIDTLRAVSYFDGLLSPSSKTKNPLKPLGFGRVYPGKIRLLLN
jgi:hypothetical protein